MCVCVRVRANSCSLLPPSWQATSTHRLWAFKETYLRLRALIDAGCVFVGHGLRKDCRTLNILLPPSQVRRGGEGRPVSRCEYPTVAAPAARQVVDTVLLYKLEGQRNLSLKFLASHVLSDAAGPKDFQVRRGERISEVAAT